MEILLVLFITVVMTAAITTWEGFVLTKLWAWFVVPTFGLPMLTVPVAIGICLIAAFLTHQQSFKVSSGDELKDAFNAWGYGIFVSLTIFFVGWIVKSFFM
jgi:hypothetical protein